MAATLSHSAHAIHAQTASPIHDAPAYENADLQLHPTTPQPLSHDSAHHLQSITSAIMDTEDHLTPEPAIPRSPSFPSGRPSPLIHDDSNMEGAEGTAVNPPLAVNPWLQPVQPIFDGRNSPLHNTPTTSVNIVDVPNAVDAPPLAPVHPSLPIDLYPGTPPPPPALAPAPRAAAEDSEEEDDEDDDRSHISDERARSFYPFNEDTTVPDAEETRIMQGYVENSALDDKHWQSRTFFDLQDPELVPKEQGKIEWTLNDFNGTKENPRKNLLITSPTVRIGGHDWRIKLLPHGNMHTDRLSLYIENVSVQSSPPEEWPADKLPLPLSGDAKVMRRTTVAAQISIVIYNPEEPRVNEFKADASQFSQDSPDHGWTRFTSLPWYEIHRRSYAQRQPLLRNDTLAIKAFIRVIDDPTGCLWSPKDSQRLALTGLQPFFGDFEACALYPVLALWLHLRPFRRMLYDLSSTDRFTKQDDSIITHLQSILWRMRSRVGWINKNPRAPHVGDFVADFFSKRGASHTMDAMQAMESLFVDMEDRLKVNKNALGGLYNLFGTDSFSGNRRCKQSIIGKTSIQEIVDQGLPEILLENEVLTLELERQVFDSKKRVWKKLLNKVRLDDQITIGRRSRRSTYTLYGFITHEGYLRAGKYSSYFRPGGPGGLWYTYMHNKDPACQTRAQAVGTKEGVFPPKAVEEPFTPSDRPLNYDHVPGQDSAVAYVVIYVRSPDTFELGAKESWAVPEWIPKMYGSQSGTTNGEDDTLHYGDTDDEDEEMNDLSEGSVQSDETLSNITIDYISQPYYQGQVNNFGQYHGYGHMIYLNGNEYSGNFRHHQRSEYGKMAYANGDTYDGQWAMGRPQGHGNYTSHRTGNVYTGNWENGKKSGTGTTYHKISEDEAKLCRICYSTEVNAAFYECGHVLACVDCAKRMEECPICKRRIRDVLKLYPLVDCEQN
ncbi:hypothetical protein M436DRAFT_80029 [Aureobasidium namibiae CBS 147.97]|uniref:RING-type domain-containing protein n=1 Tax=Aureobasidium namibiae CBS 147.97 TaxID=1043004 RepID=A0A074WR48_9PEZI